MSQTHSVLGKKGTNNVADSQRAPGCGGGSGARRCRRGHILAGVLQPRRCEEQQHARVFDFQLWSPE